jgi:hypothetical protein
LPYKVSFDFDGTLEHIPKQEYAQELIGRGIEVWIVTSRFGDSESYKLYYHTYTEVQYTHKDLYEVADKLKIPKDRIIFTNMENKWPIIKNHNFIWHIDDDWVENRLILNNTKTKAIDALGSTWKNKCERILKQTMAMNK